MIGSTKWYNDLKGYGFILPDDGGKDIFVHANSLAKSHIQTLKEGQRVEYDLMAGRKGPEAINVRIL